MSRNEIVKINVRVLSLWMVMSLFILTSCGDYEAVRSSLPVKIPLIKDSFEMK